MNTKRIIFWVSFIIIFILIIWGLIVASNKTPLSVEKGTPMALSSEDHIRGPEDAPVTIIEYSDFQCPACRSYYPVVERLLEEASSSVRFVYRHFPLHPLPHKNAKIAAQAAEAAGLQGKFWEMYEVLFENQTAWDESPTASAMFETYAGEIGLDVAKFRTDISGDSVESKVDSDKSDGVSIGINSTPTFFINGKVIDNPQSYDQFKALVEATASSSAI